MSAIRFGSSLAVTAAAFLLSAPTVSATTSTAGDPVELTVLVSTGFELGGLGGATTPSINDGDPVNRESKLLDNLALEFMPRQQIGWRRRLDPLPSVHYFSFSYAAEELGGVITHFLDSPRIKRTDIPVELGRHHVEIFHDVVGLRSVVRVDGQVRTEFAQILAADAGPSRFRNYTTRLANQLSPPGNSRGAFQIDNFDWKVGFEFPEASIPVPEPGTALLLGLGLAALAGHRR